MNITSEFYRRVIQYLNDEISVIQLEDWFLPNFDQILTLPDCPPRDLAGDIQLALAEMSNGDRTEAELKALIRELIESSDIVICSSAAYSISVGTINPAPIFLDISSLDDTGVFYEAVIA
ncbi:MAG: hypothetical protein WBC82_12400 [Dehalococcoidia bacterium]